MPPNVSTSFLGLRLNSPIVVGSCPLTLNPETVRELAIAGAGAIVLPSLFQEQISDDRLSRVAEETQPPGSASHFCESSDETYNGGPQAYLAAIRDLKSASGLPVIASLNGFSKGRWLRIAAEIQAAGADALEFTLEVEIADARLSGNGVEQRMLDGVSELCDLVSIPVSVKLSPFHTSLPNLAWRLSEAGASGLVCFAHDPTWEVTSDRIEATLSWSLTPASSVNQTIAGLLRVRAGGPSVSIAASGGISTSEDIVKAVLAGADVAMLTSEIYRAGPDVVAHLFEGLCHFLERNHHTRFVDFVHLRPAPKSSLRGDYLKCITRGESRDDPIPYIPPRTGDRWGHLL